MPEEREASKLPPWSEWITLALAVGPYLCVAVVFFMKKLESAFWSTWGQSLRRLDLEMPPLIAAPILAMMSLVSYAALKWAGRHSKKNTVGLVLALVWWAGLFGLTQPWAIIGVTERPRRSRCASNLKQMSYACHLYAKDHDGAFPPDLASTFPNYVSDEMVFVCPTARSKGRLTAQEVPRDEPLPDCQVCYCYVSGLKADDRSQYILAFDEEWNHDGEGMNTLFVGHNVEWHSDTSRIHEQLEEQKETLAAQGRKMRIIRPAWSRWPEGPLHKPTPWYRTGTTVALMCTGGVVLGAFTALLVIRRRRRRAPQNQT